VQLGVKYMSVTNSRYRWLTQLPALLHAEVTAGVVDPHLFRACTRLTHLTVAPETVIVDESRGLHDFVSNLHNLPELVSCSLAVARYYLFGLPHDACSCLTAGSKLQELRQAGLKIAQGGWQHVFPVDRQLGLTCLELSGINAVSWHHGMEEGEMLDADNFQKLVQCCPDLKQLRLTCATQKGIDLQPVVQLSGLTQLVLGGLLNAMEVQERRGCWVVSVGFLRQLPGLQFLKIEAPDYLKRTETLQLTVLTQLTKLKLDVLEDYPERLGFRVS
jgi:hypothetical protein